jgi:hypothetical protein
MRVKGGERREERGVTSNKGQVTRDKVMQFYHDNHDNHYNHENHYNHYNNYNL